MKEFTITVSSDRLASPLDNLSIPAAGPIRPEPIERKSAGHISSVTISARLVDVEYEEAQTLLEKMKEDVKKT